MEVPINIEDVCGFMYSRLKAELEMDDVEDYVVGIPQAIIDMAQTESRDI